MAYIIMENRYINADQIASVRVLNTCVEVFTSGGGEYMYANGDKELFMKQFKAIEGLASELPTEITVKEFVEQNYAAKIDAGECRVFWPTFNVNIYGARVVSAFDTGEDYAIYWRFSYEFVNGSTLLQVIWLK